MRFREIKPADTPCHKHHIFPKSIYGKNDRVVRLTYREHFIAHQLLTKYYKKKYGENDYRTIKMAKSVMYMTSNEFVRSSKDYSFFCNILSENMKNKNPMHNIEVRDRVKQTKAKLPPIIYKDSTLEIWSKHRTKMNILNNPMKNEFSRKKASEALKLKHKQRTSEELESQRIANSNAGKVWWKKMIENHTEEELKEYRNSLIPYIKEKNSKKYILTKITGETIIIKNMADFARSLGYLPCTFRQRLKLGKETEGFIKFELYNEL